MRYYTAGEKFTIVTSYIFAIIAVIFVILVAVSPKMEDGATRLFGYELRLVATNSMEDNGSFDASKYEIGSFSKDTVVALHCVPSDAEEAMAWYEDVKEGDVLTVRYTYNTQVTITHRVRTVEKKEDGSGYIITLAADNSDSDAGMLYQTIDTSSTDGLNYVIGKVIWKNHSVGVVIGGAQRALAAIVKN